MARVPHHPAAEQISLSGLYDALSDPVRRRIVGMLAEQGETHCSGFLEHGSKTNLSYHFARLREAGLTRARVEGTMRCITLRSDDLEALFPGWLAAVIESIRNEERKAAATAAKARRAASKIKVKEAQR